MLQLLDNFICFVEIVAVLFIDFEIVDQGLDSGCEDCGDGIPWANQIIDFDLHFLAKLNHGLQVRKNDGFFILGYEFRF